MFSRYPQFAELKCPVHITKKILPYRIHIYISLKLENLFHHHMVVENVKIEKQHTIK